MPATPATVNQINEVQAAGYTDAAEMLTLRAAIADYSQWSTTPLDYTMNPFHLFDSGNEVIDPNFTLAVLQQARNSTRMVQAGNHALSYPIYAFRHLHLRPDAGGRRARSLGDASQLPDRLAGHARRAQASAAIRPSGTWPLPTPSPTASPPTAATSSSGTSRDQNKRLPGLVAQPGAARWPQIVASGIAPTTGGARRRLGARLPGAGVRDRLPRDGRLFGHRCGAAGERHAAGRLQRHADLPERRHTRRHQRRRHRVGPGQRLDPVVRGLARPGEHGAGEPPRHARLRHATWCRSRRPTAAGTPRSAPSASRSRQPRLHPAGSSPGGGPAAFQGSTACSLSAACKPRKSLPAISRSARAATPRCSRRWRPAPTARRASRSAAPSRCWPAARRASPGRSAPRRSRSTPPAAG